MNNNIIANFMKDFIRYFIKILWFALVMFFVIVTMRSVSANNLTLHQNYLPVESDLSIDDAVSLSQNLVCEAFNVTQGFNLSFVQLAFRRSGAQLGAKFNVRIYNLTKSDSHVDKVISMAAFQDGTDITLSSSLVYYNLSVPRVSLEFDKAYAVCYYYNASDVNYIHIDTNSSNAYADGGMLRYTGSWDYTLVSFRDVPFGLYSNETISGLTPSLAIYTNLRDYENITLPNYTIYFNGTSINNSDIYSCNLYENNTLLLNKSNIDLSVNQNFSPDFTDYEGNYKYNISCSNANATQHNSINQDYQKTTF